MALLDGCARYVPQRLLATEPNSKDLAGKHSIQGESGPDESHWAGLASDVQFLVRLRADFLRLVHGSHSGILKLPFAAGDTRVSVLGKL